MIKEIRSRQSRLQEIVKHRTVKVEVRQVES